MINAVVNITMKAPYTLDAVQAYIGPDPLPKNGANHFTDNPADYPLQFDLTDATSLNFTVAGGNYRIYVLVHAVVNGL